MDYDRSLLDVECWTILHFAELTTKVHHQDGLIVPESAVSFAHEQKGVVTHHFLQARQRGTHTLPGGVEIPHASNVVIAMTTAALIPGWVKVLEVISDPFNRASYGGTTPQRMDALVRSFPSLREAPEGWDYARFERWAKRSGAIGGSSAARYSVGFVMLVWNQQAEHSFPFNAVHAFGVWDDRHRDAFLSWCMAPFFP